MLRNPAIKNVEEHYDAFLSNELCSVYGLVLNEIDKNRLWNRLKRDWRFIVDDHCHGLLEELTADGVDLFKGLLRQERNWFYPWQAMQFLKQWFLTQTEPMRIWSVGCGSGQEPYSISCSYSEVISFSRKHPRPPLSIVGTDISGSNLKLAKMGLYTKEDLNCGVSWLKKRKFFQKREDGLYQLKELERERVSFQPHHLLRGLHSLGAFDFIFCDRVLPYFSKDLRYAIICRLMDRLKPKGYLFLGYLPIDFLDNEKSLFPLKPIFAEGCVFYQKEKM